MNRRVLLVVFSIVMAALLLSIDWPDRDAMSGDHIIRFMIISQALLLVYLLALIVARRIDWSSRQRALWIIVIAVAVIMRVAAAVDTGEASYISDDAYRYIFEGKLVLHGYNPLIITPEDMAGSGMADDTIYPNINHPWLPTIYPPLSLYFFSLAYLLGGNSLIGFKILSVACELVTMALVWLFAARTGRQDWRVLIYMLSPLVVVEFMISNHLDILAMPFFVGALIAINSRRPIASGLLLGLATMVKLYAGMFVPVLFFFYRGRDRWRFAGSLAAVSILFYLPFLMSAGTDVFGSLWKYLGTWQFNGSIFIVLKQVFSEAVARPVCALLFAVAVIAVSLLYRRSFPAPLERMLLLFGAYTLFSPSVFPWYLVWIIPLLIWQPAWSFLILTGTIFLSYHVLIGYYDGGRWTPIAWLGVLEYLPFYIALGFDIKKLRGGLRAKSA